MTFLRKLREAARTCSNVDYRHQLHEAASRLAECVEAFSLDIDDESLRELNGAWAFADRVFKNMPPEGTPAPVSGPTEPARLAA